MEVVSPWEDKAITAMPAISTSPGVTLGVLPAEVGVTVVEGMRADVVEDDVRQDVRHEPSTSILAGRTTR
jgi:hypothetical protein